MNVLRLYIQVFLRQTGMSPKKWLFYPFMIVIFASIWLFYGFIVDFQAYYINELKGVYPEYFLVTNGITVESPEKELLHRPETFEVSTSFSFAFDAESVKTTLVNVGVRAAEPGMIPAVDGGRLDEETVYLNAVLYKKVAASPGFSDDSVYIDLYQGGRAKVHLRPFELRGSKGWVVLSTALAEKAGIIQNVNTVYPQGPVDEKSLRAVYLDNGQRLSVWHERIPFTSAVFYKILLNVYVVLVIAVLTLALVLSFGVVTDIVAEINKLIRLSLLYGVNLFASIASFFVICLINVSMIYGSASILKDTVRIAVNPAMPDIGGSYSIGFSLLEIVALVLFCLVMSIIVVYRRYRKPEIIFGQ